MHPRADSTTAPANGQARRIDLVVGYQADEAKSLARINSNGQLIAYKADDQEMEPPAQTVPELYRWLQDHGYVPHGFKWLGWKHGLRQRCQIYIWLMTATQPCLCSIAMDVDAPSFSSSTSSTPWFNAGAWDSPHKNKLRRNPNVN